jgi:hypothetical protein
MERFGFAGLWQHVGSTVIAALFPIADAVVSYLNAVTLPSWAHALVGVAAAVLAFYKGKALPALKPAP